MKCHSAIAVGISIPDNRLSESDHRERYYADKCKSCSPDCGRKPDEVDEYLVEFYPGSDSPL